MAAEAVAGGIELTVDRGWIPDDAPSAMRLVEVAETQRPGRVPSGQSLTFTFDVGALVPLGPATLRASIANLRPTDLLLLGAEGDLIGYDLERLPGRVTAEAELSQERLEELAADGRIIFTATAFALLHPSATINEFTLELSFHVPDSAFLVRIDDAFVGKLSAFDEAPSGLPPAADPDDERSTFTDSAADFPGAGEGLTGAILQLVGGPGAGQERLVLGRLEGDPTHTLILNGPWSTDPVPGESVYRIERFDGLALPSVQVQVNDDDAPGLVVDETRGIDDGVVTPDDDTITALIEGSDGDQPGERDVVRVRLSREPATRVRVELVVDGAQLELADLGGAPLEFLEFTGGAMGNWHRAGTATTG